MWIRSAIVELKECFVFATEAQCQETRLRSSLGITCFQTTCALHKYLDALAPSQLGLCLGHESWGQGI